MQLAIQHPAFKAQRLVVETAQWFRGPRLLLNSTVVPKKNGRYTVAADSGAEIAIQMKYNYLDPIPKVKVGDETAVLASPLKWYEYVWIGIPIVLVLFGGAIGGLVGAMGATASGRVFRSDRGSFAKYGLSAAISLGAFVAFAILATVFQSFVGTPHK